MKQAVVQLCEHPHIGRMVPEFGDPAIRERIIAPYRVLYLLQADVVYVLGIYHGRRQLPDKMGA